MQYENNKFNASMFYLKNSTSIHCLKKSSTDKMAVPTKL